MGFYLEVPPDFKGTKTAYIEKVGAKLSPGPMPALWRGAVNLANPAMVVALIPSTTFGHLLLICVSPREITRAMEREATVDFYAVPQDRIKELNPDAYSVFKEWEEVV